MMAGSPGIVKRRIREMTASNTADPAPLRPFRQFTTISTAKPFKKTENSKSISCKENLPGGISIGASDSLETSQLHNDDLYRINHEFRASRDPLRTTPSTLLAPTPFRSVTQRDRSTHDNPPALLPKRSKSSPGSPEKPKLPPKPKRLSATSMAPSIDSSESATTADGSRDAAIASTSAPPLDKGTVSAKSYLVEDSDEDVGDSPLQTSFTKFNQKVQKLDLLRRRQSYSEFEELIEKKRELRERMMSKIFCLRKERDVLLEDKRENDEEGRKLLTKLEKVASSQEVEKYRKFLEEIEQITKLTVSLTIRISRLSKRMERLKQRSECDMLNVERMKQQRLIEQMKEAESLHRNTDRRGMQVRKILSGHLGESDSEAYDAFLAALIHMVTDLKETEQRIQLGEEQLIALNDNLPKSE